MQASQHRTVRPLFQPPLLAPRRPVQAPARAQLDGLEVKESSFGEWLAAGGDRRATDRNNRTAVG